MPDRFQVIHDETMVATRWARARFGTDFLRGPRLVRVDERNVTERENMRAHDVPAGADVSTSCHKDYVGYVRSYEMRIVFEIEVWWPDGSISWVEIIGQTWIRIQGEAIVRTEWHCPPGFFDLPALPGNYASFKAGRKVIWQGEPVALAIHSGGRTRGYKRPAGTAAAIRKLYRVGRKSARRAARKRR